MVCAPPRAASDLSLAEALARELQDLGVFMALCSCTGQRYIPPGCLLPVAERVRPAMPSGPTLTREQAGCCGQQGSVRAPEVRTTGLPGKDRQLVTKNEDLDLALSALLARWHKAKEIP
jgi:hypothetical protein